MNDRNDTLISPLSTLLPLHCLRTLSSTLLYVKLIFAGSDQANMLK